jgi:predicted AlkP superfamily phosphohydrolase/phosphomutase/tetratricopeptide (TPR) repeat protein
VTKKTGLAVLFAVAAAAASCRRTEQSAPAMAAPVREPPPETSDVATRAGKRDEGKRPPVIWLGLDGLDWELLDGLAAAGGMPNWKRLTEEGYSARLASFSPLLSPLLWTSAATGVGPDVHRVLDFQEVDPRTGRKVPISGRSRDVAAVWNYASGAGRTVGVVGWWATHPAEQVDGFFVSDHASPILFERSSYAGVVYPAALEPAVRETVAGRGRVDDDELGGWISGADAPAAERRESLRRILGATRASHLLARELYDRQLPDLLVLYLEGTDEIGHVFGSYAPPKLSCVSDADAARYGGVVARYYALVDSVLGQWMRRAEEDGATLIVHSDHGFKWGSERPCDFGSKDAATAAFWHRPNGVFAAWGGSARKAAGRAEAAILDVAPTVLSLLELPADPRMPGKPLAAAFTGLPQPGRESWLAETPVRRLAAAEVSPEESSEYTRKLIALGYISGADTQPLAPPGGDRPGMTEGAWNNLGTFLRDTRNDARGARQAFEKSLQLRPDYPAALFNLAVLERAAGRHDAAADWLMRSLNAQKADPGPAVTAWAREYEKTGRQAAARSLLLRARREHPGSEEIARAYGHLLQRSGDCEGALQVLAPFEAATRQPRTINALALFQTCLGNRPEVVRLLERSLALDPNQPEVARSLALARGPSP